ncbi:DUF6082 family protein [Amycolatopsis australiensis]|uniref:Uncharacterized protein n=1 Tax=Amycolatopsis australiensis TaxID=546364 RepID=A0A1K1S4H4_9PSEU|nr:DUF6082 family protein [Amycolatopsis australiensis]SFW79249.1 hypothetical protein SAMN04489730_4690 [Amycolatopsis australiensis]
MRTSLRIRTRRLALVAAVSAAGAACVLLVFLSPLSFPLLDRIDGADWAHLSDIGQAYGGVSALIATIGVFGVAASLLGQVRESRRAGIRDERQLHSAILLFAVEHPEYLQCWGGYSVENNGKATSYRAFCNLVFLNYYSMYLSGQYDLDGVRRNIAHFFEGELGREYWKHSHESWMSGKDKGRRRRAFLNVVEQQFRRAEAGGPPTPWDRSGVEVGGPPPAGPDDAVATSRVGFGLALGGVAVGAAGGWLVRRLASR